MEFVAFLFVLPDTAGSVLRVWTMAPPMIEFPENDVVIRNRIQNCNFYLVFLYISIDLYFNFYGVFI